MTNHPNPNSAAQAVQEAERNAAAESYFDARPSLDTVEGRRIYEAGFDRAYALLSKLRAPVADERFKPPFGNCSFRMCDLPGQCRGEGKCHHPQSTPVAGERATKALNRIERRASDDGRQRDIDDLAVVRAALASAPLPKPRPVEEQPDGTVTPVDPVDMTSAPVADPETMEEIHRQERERSPWVLPKDPTLPQSAPVAGEAQKPVAWFIDWPDEPELGHYIAESPADSGRNRPLVFADASPQESTPVPEEPVYAYRRKGLDDFVTCDRERFDELSAKPRLFETRIFYAAPQASAEDEWKAAIRKFMDTAIPALAAIANVHTPDEIDALEAMPREPVIDQVRRLSQACEELSRQVRPERPKADKDGGQQRAGDGKTREALSWYAEKVAGCRKFGPDGEAARHALDRDGGQLARAALSAPQAEQGERDA